MTIWAIVPVKPLRRGKSRLSGILDDEQRAKLNQELLEHTLSVLGTMKELIQPMVVSRDPQALAIARKYNALTVREDGNPHLNTALTRATIVSQASASQGVLVLPADLPLLRREDILDFLKRAVGKMPVVVIAPDRHRKGTNALLTIPAGSIKYQYGENSFERHCESARKMSVHVEVVESETLGLDLDLPEDLELIQKSEKSNIKSFPMTTLQPIQP